MFDMLLLLSDQQHWSAEQDNSAMVDRAFVPETVQLSGPPGRDVFPYHEKDDWEAVGWAPAVPGVAIRTPGQQAADRAYERALWFGASLMDAENAALEALDDGELVDAPFVSGVLDTVGLTLTLTFGTKMKSATLTVGQITCVGVLSGPNAVHYRNTAQVVPAGTTFVVALENLGSSAAPSGLKMDYLGTAISTAGGVLWAPVSQASIT